jgi:hypothetical protein
VSENDGNEPLDLSALDPARDGGRWERRIQETVARAVAARPPRPGPLLAALFAWRRPALVLAAACALAVWGAALLGGRARGPTVTGTAARPAASRDAAYVLSRWAESEERPGTDELLAIMGGPR